MTAPDSTYDLTLSGTAYRFEVYTTTGAFTWVPPAGVTSYDALVVGGGGAGGRRDTGGPGGGGAGGLLWLTAQACTPGVGIAGSVGVGGTAAGSGAIAGSGGNSTLDAATASGGGGGQGNPTAAAANGGSGGGGCGGVGGQNGLAGAGTGGQGNAGGAGHGDSSTGARGGGGGGGAGAAGQAAAPAGTAAGNGGDGVDHSANVGTSVGAAGWFGGGGGGGRSAGGAGHGGTGGQGGGGKGNGATVAGAAGTNGTGGGGGGAGGATAGGAGGTGIVIVRYVIPADPPGFPTNLTADPDVDSIEFAWDPPASGGPVTGYEVRLDGGGWVDKGASFTHTFTGLAPSTQYDLFVRAYGPGGSSASASIPNVETDAPPPTPPTPVPPYRVRLELGDLDPFDVVSSGTDPDPGYGVRLPLALSWSIPDAVEFFPAPTDPHSFTCGVLVASADDLAGLSKGSPVRFRMWSDPDADPDTTDPWQTWDGVVTQLDGERTDAGDFLATVYATDGTGYLADPQVGYTDDWPIESIGDRVERICDEAGVTFGGFMDTDGTQGWLPARTAGAPMSALTALRGALADYASRYDSEGPTYYGRGQLVASYDPDTDTITASVKSFRRRVLPGHTTELSADLVHAQGRWQRRPYRDGATWGLVDRAVFGSPDATPPFTRRTGLLDWFGEPPGSEANESAVTRSYLGNSILAASSDQLAGWYHKLLRYDAYVDPDPVGGWVSTGDEFYPALWFVRPVVIPDIAVENQLNGVDYLAGTLTGCRLVIPAAGEYYMELTVRSEVLDGTDLPS